MLALATLVAAAALAAPPEDAPLPWNPIDGAAAGDWAQYRATDPAQPGERLPDERRFVTEVRPDAVIVRNPLGGAFPFKPGPEGRSAVAYLRGFLGEGWDEHGARLQSVAAVPDVVEAGGARYEGVRIEATLVSPVVDGRGNDGGAVEAKATFRVWVAKEVRAGGLVRAEFAVEMGAETRRGALELVAHGTAAAEPPRPPEAPPPPGGR